MEFLRGMYAWRHSNNYPGKMWVPTRSDETVVFIRGSELNNLMAAFGSVPQVHANWESLTFMEGINHIYKEEPWPYVLNKDPNAAD